MTESKRPKKKASKRRPRLAASPSPRKGLLARRPGLFWGGVALVGTLAVAATTLLFGYGAVRPTTGNAVEVDWPSGLGSAESAALLAELGLVDGKDTMTVFLRATGGTSEFVPGPHLLFRGATPWELRRMLSRSFLRPSAKLVIPEGWNRFDIGARLEKLRIAGKKAFLAASVDAVLLEEVGVIAHPSDASSPANRPESAEGYLFPATYEFGVDSDPRDVVRRLVAEANKRWDALLVNHGQGLDSLKGSLGFSRFEVLTMASIIEKEAAVDSERPIIASVFLNRLIDPSFQPKRLQSDPTSLYGCIAWPDEAPSCTDFNGKPSPALNRDPKNRYSTYVRTGLPPGPIGNPGTRSLEAVLAPAATHFFYFVAAGNGHHTFSENLDAHNDAVHRGRAP